MLTKPVYMSMRQTSTFQYWGVQRSLQSRPGRLAVSTLVVDCLEARLSTLAGQMLLGAGFLASFQFFIGFLGDEADVHGRAEARLLYHRSGSDLEVFKPTVGRGAITAMSGEKVGVI